MACSALCDGSSGPTSCNAGLILVGRCTTSISQTLPVAEPIRMDWSGQALVPNDFGADVTCRNCSISLTTNVVFDVEVEDNNLVSLYVGIKAGVDAHLEALFSTGRAFQRSYSQRIGEVSLPPIIFFVGAFPVTIGISVPLNIGASVDVSGTIQATTGATLSGELNTGLSFANGGLRPGLEFHATPRALSSAVDLATQGTLQAFLEPAIEITAQGVATMSLPFTSSLNASFNLGGSSTTSKILARFSRGLNKQVQTHDTQQLTGRLSIAAAASIGGTIGVNLGGVPVGPHLELPPVPLLDYERDVWAWP